MSAIICHYYHGKRAMEEAKFHPVESSAFTLGLQGPDLFTYSLLFEKDPSAEAEAFCDAMTDVDLQKLSAFFAQYAESGDAEILSYAQGIACYCALEAEVRPFILYGAEMIPTLNPEQSKEDARNLVESSLDTIVLRYETGKLGTSFNLKQAVPMNDSLQRKLSALYAKLYTELTGRTIGEALAAELLADGVKSIGKLNDRTMLKRQFLKRRERKKKQVGGWSSLFRNVSEDEDYDYANVCESEWQWPPETGEIRTSTYFDLYEAAVTRAASLL